MHRSIQDVQEAVIKLESNLGFCVRYCCFGNDNRKKIAAMVDVIKNNRSKLWINSNYLTPSELMHEQPDNVMWQSAMDAKEWLDGTFNIEDLLFKDIDVTNSKLFDGILFSQ